jgi:amidophosphoribosyltransferase
MAESAPLAGQLLEFSEQDDRPREECGVWASLDPANPHLLEHAYTGAEQNQHRGEEGAGAAIISTDEPGMRIIKGVGKVHKVLGGDGTEQMPGVDVVTLMNISAHAYGVNLQVRYGTNSNYEDPEAALQPFCMPGGTFEYEDYKKEKRSFYQPAFSFSHNGNFIETEKLVEKYGLTEFSTDSDVIARSIYTEARDYCKGDIELAITRLLPELRGAFCITVMTEEGKLMAAKDRNAVRPLQLGKTETGGYIVTSEVKAISHIDGATWQREINAGEMVVITKDMIERGEEPRSSQWAKANLATCLLEFVYFSNKENIINGHLVSDVRREFGRMVWEEYQSQLADEAAAAMTDQDKELTEEAINAVFDTIVAEFGDEFDLSDDEIGEEPAKSGPWTLPVPNSGLQYAHGYAEASGREEKKLFIKNEEQGRSFIQTTTVARKLVARLKLLFDHDVLKEIAKPGVIVEFDENEDSIVRGNTASVTNERLRDIIHSLTGFQPIINMLVGSPPVIKGCHLGVDIGPAEGLLANKHNGDRAAMAKEIKADRVVYNRLEPMVKYLGGNVCSSCMGGPGPDMIPHQERPLVEHEPLERYIARQVLVSVS